MSNHGHRGVLSFRIQISPLCSECPVPCPPPSELSSHALCVSSRSSPFTVSHHQHHRHHPHHHHHHLSTCHSDFSTSICPVPNSAMKVTGSSIHTYRKSDFGVCANTGRVFSPHLCVGFLFLILYPGLLLLLLPPPYTYNNNLTHTNLTYNNFTHTNLTYINFTHTNLTYNIQSFHTTQT